MTERLRPTPERVFTSREIIHSEEFPEDPEKRLEAILAGISNNETKAATLLLLSPYPQTPPELYHSLREITGANWRVSGSLAKDYCNQTLVPIGLVAEENFLTMGALEWTVSYSTTEAGEKFGKPIAAFLLAKSVEWQTSFAPIFGKTGSTGERRAPLTRLKILEALYQSQHPVGDVDLQEAIGIKYMFTRHLMALAKAGLIRHELADPERGLSAYELVHDAVVNSVKPVGKLSWLTPRVAQIFAESQRPLTNRDIAQKLRLRFPEKYPGDKTPDIYAISSVLAGLERRGILKTQGMRLSEVELLEPGKGFLEEVMDPIIKVLHDDKRALEEMEHHISSWRKNAPKAVALYRETVSYNRGWRQDTLRVLKAHPVGLRPSQLAKIFGTTYNNTISRLVTLREEGKIGRRRKGNAAYYFVINL